MDQVFDELLNLRKNLAIEYVYNFGERNQKHEFFKLNYDLMSSYGRLIEKSVSIQDFKELCGESFSHYREYYYEKHNKERKNNNVFIDFVREKSILRMKRHLYPNLEDFAHFHPIIRH